MTQPDPARQLFRLTRTHQLSIIGDTKNATRTGRGLTAIEMEVEENFGQSAVYRVALE